MGGHLLHQGKLGSRQSGGSEADTLQKYISVPIIVKGVQSVEDIELCVKAGAEGVLIVGVLSILPIV